MCTILVARGVHPSFPLILAANRDELRARASLPPRELDAEREILGGQDRVAGGTWLGVARRRFFAAVTNFRGERPNDPQRASRGALVMSLVREANGLAARRLVERLRPNTYNPANLLFGDVDQVLLACLRDDAPPRVLELPLGLSVVTNGDLGDDRRFPKARRLAKQARELPAEPDALVHHLHAALSDHHRAPEGELPAPAPGSFFTPTLLSELDALCVHTEVGPALAYGTVSSSILLFDRAGTLSRWDFADGPPCVTESRPLEALLAEK